MDKQHFLFLLTQPPSQRAAWHAYQLAQQLVNAGHTAQAFFYGQAVQMANAWAWLPADQLNLTQAWQQLNIPKQVCVSAALAAGVSNTDNALRHQLIHEPITQLPNLNLAHGFELVGLGELVMALQQPCKVLHF